MLSTSTSTLDRHDDDLLTSHEVAHLLRQHHETVLKGLRTGRIPGAKPLGRWLTRRGDLMDLFSHSENQRRVTAASVREQPHQPVPPRRQHAGGRASF